MKQVSVILFVCFGALIYFSPWFAIPCVVSMGWFFARFFEIKVVDEAQYEKLANRIEALEKDIRVLNTRNSMR